MNVDHVMYLSMDKIGCIWVFIAPNEFEKLHISKNIWHIKLWNFLICIENLQIWPKNMYCNIRFRNKKFCQKIRIFPRNKKFSYMYRKWWPRVSSEVSRKISCVLCTLSIRSVCTKNKFVNSTTNFRALCRKRVTLCTTCWSGNYLQFPCLRVKTILVHAIFSSEISNLAKN
jgi:hypothetical protein